MRLLDLFCGAGGAGMGYHRAGFEVVGVDINLQKHYPFEFHQADALEYLAEHGREFDVIHASPPCQAYSLASVQWRKTKEYPDMISAARQLLQTIGKPYVIENVLGAPLINPIKLNGAFFGMNLRRTRLFETSLVIDQPELPPDPKSNFRTGRPPRESDPVVIPVGHFSNVKRAREVMDIDWMTRDELAQAIPPAYTEWIGRQIIEALKEEVEG